VVAIPLGSNWVLYAESLQGVDEAVSGLKTALVFGVPVLAFVLGVLVWFVVGRTLRPVRDAMERERRLVADVSHELRTPLAGARALLESESELPAEIELNRLEALAVLTRLEAMTNDLLVEARNDGSDQVRMDSLVDLDDVVLRVVDLVPTRPGMEIDPSTVSAGQVRGNEQDLQRMISNLVSNAVRHARSEVRLQLADHDGAVTLTVSDDGPGIAAEDRERVFDRFTRLDGARSRDDAGVGLGLPIVRSVVTAHRGTIEVRDSVLGGAAFIVTLPAAVPLARPHPPLTGLPFLESTDAAARG
jgi:signal transduction histidine kinase